MRERREYYGGKKGRVGMGGKREIRRKIKWELREGRRASEGGRRRRRAVQGGQCGKLANRIGYGARQVVVVQNSACPTSKTNTAHSMKHAEGREDEGAKGNNMGEKERWEWGRRGGD